MQLFPTQPPSTIIESSKLTLQMLTSNIGHCSCGAILLAPEISCYHQLLYTDGNWEFPMINGRDKEAKRKKFCLRKHTMVNQAAQL
ncbi:hypothetical protein PoB_001150100 [Plakobranchus ocellatus]|uniref:Uncharacterized protein n=1 Tax=Plakobranchus ocellatus TaxID=259542 RepID=A0AAV3YCD3_9GAST|nr:hypothetical protein PoB_001150100 [Plakobranchus ocellatus]